MPPDDNVVSLKPVDYEEGHRQQSLAILREALRRTEAGEVHEIIMVIGTRGKYETAFSGCSDFIRQLGHLDMVMAKIRKHISEGMT